MLASTCHLSEVVMRQRLVEARGGGPVVVGAVLAGVARCSELDVDQLLARVADVLSSVQWLSTIEYNRNQPRRSGGSVSLVPEESCVRLPCGKATKSEKKRNTKSSYTSSEFVAVRSVGYHQQAIA